MRLSLGSAGRFIVPMVAIGLIAASAAADGISPVRLKIKERESGRFLAQWRVPKQLPPRAIPSPVLPESCRSVGERTLTERPGAWFVRQPYLCSEGLSGESIGVQFSLLNASVSTLLRVELLSGDRYAHMLAPGEESWRVPDATGGGVRALFRGARQAVLDGATHFAGNAVHLALVAALMLFGGFAIATRCATLFDVDLALFDQQASRVESGRKNFGTFSWRVMGDAKLFDLRDSDHLSGLGRGSVSWNTFGTAGLNYDPADQGVSENVGSISTLNATVFDSAAVVDELYWKQVAWGGKLLVLGGKIDMLYHFDTNRVANDAYSQFFSYSLQNNPSVPGPLYGGFGAIVRTNLPKSAYLMFGVGDSSMDKAVAPWKTLDNDSWYQLLELGLRPSLPVLGKGNYRITPWHNHLFGEDGFGIGLSFDQELGWKGLVAFFRFGYGDKDVTPVETFVAGGIGLEAPFDRSDDLAAIGVAWSDPSPGTGDRDETLVEILYRVGLAKGISITPDLRLVFEPANSPNHDFVVVPGVRLHLVF